MATGSKGNLEMTNEIHPDYYEVLQVSPYAEEEIIQAAYRQLARKWHPAKNPGDPSACQKMKLFNEAYQILTNPQKRHEHDVRRTQPHTSDVVEWQRRAEQQRRREEAKIFYRGSAFV